MGNGSELGGIGGRAKRKGGRKSFEDEDLRASTAADVGSSERVRLDAKGAGKGEMHGVACTAN